ncbi:hypothetical protein ANCCEY_08576 [Ancylostoma ceylanicum]|uniref:Uncharacterized protein n=2 Tax=Ancylostoma ceylanicum TaxID=53326 RepID=A0A0D6LK74_9BILA|nr:hypothetical protein ANCCEY_08576 [Ancylostoma ceylanicum]
MYFQERNLRKNSKNFDVEPKGEKIKAGRLNMRKERRMTAYLQKRTVRFQLSLDQMRIVADEGARLANLCSTRMGRAQQMCKERADAVMAIDSFLRNSSDMERKIRDLNKQVDKLVRFCNQTEQAMTHLEALNSIVRTEEEVDLIRQQTRSAATIINMDPSPSPALVLNTSIRPNDEAREKQEEVMLEEFLSGKKPASLD